MLSQKAIYVLSQLAVLHMRSMPNYLKFTRPWAQPHSQGKLDVLENIIADHQYAIEKIQHVLEEEEVTFHRGDFPMEFTDLHDLSIDYLLSILIDYQQQFIAEIEFFVEQLGDQAIAKEIAAQCLGMAKGHLDNLKEANSANGVLQ